MRFFFAYLLNLAIFSIALFILREKGYTDTYGRKLQHIYPIFEIFFVSLFFYQLLTSKYRLWFLVIGAISLMGVFLMSFLSYGTSLPLLPWVIEEIFFLVIVMFSLYEKLNKITETPIYSMPNFWVSFGLLIYFAGTFFLFLVSISITDSSPEFKQQFNLVVACFSVIKNTLFFMAIHINKQNELASKKTIRPNLSFEDYKPKLPQPVIF